MPLLDARFKKRVSYLMATKNRAPFLKKSLSSIAKLKGKNDELIVIDGKSTDSTSRVIKNAGRLVDKFISESDLGEAHAYNKGILISEGKYIKILTDDDVFFRDGIEKAVDILEKHPEIDVILAGGLRIKDGVKNYICLPKGINYGSRISDVLKFGGCGIGMIFRKSMLAKVGLFYPKAIAVDTDFLTQCIANGATVRFARINMYTHTIEKHSGTVAKKNLWLKDRARIVEKYHIAEDNTVRRLEKWMDLYLPLVITTMLKRFKKMFKTYPSLENKYEWDGGLS